MLIKCLNKELPEEFEVIENSEKHVSVRMRKLGELLTKIRMER